MTIQLFPPDLIHDNPYQPRRDYNAQSLADLAADMRTNGMIETPSGRILADGTVQLAVGSRRRRAWAIAFPGSEMPVDVLELTDLQMSDRASSENGQRDDLNDIEKALDIQRRQKEFGMTLVEAARPYRLGASAASNLVRALKLPDGVQGMIRRGELAQGLVRELLVVHRLDPKETEKIAARVISVENEDPAELLERRIDGLFDEKAREFDSEVPWEPKWPPSPIALDPPRGELTEIPACKGCMWYFIRMEEAFCGRPECFAAKLEVACGDELARVSKKLKIPIAGPGEKTKVVYDGSETGFEMVGAVQAAIQAARPELRVVLHAEHDYHGHNRRNVLGSMHAALATIDPAATSAWIKEYRKKGEASAQAAAPAAGAEETDAQRQKRIAREEKERDERRAASSQFLRGKQEVLWLAESAATDLANHIEIAGGILDVVEDRWQRDYNLFSGWDDFNAISGRIDNAKRDADPGRKEAQARRRLIFQMIAHSLTTNSRDDFGGYSVKPEKAYDYARACTIIAKLAKETLRLKLTAGWDRAPVLHTPSNCWTCGRFGAVEGKLAKYELDAGWTCQGEGDEATDVLCPECAAAAAKEKAPKAKPAKKSGKKK